MGCIVIVITDVRLRRDIANFKYSPSKSRIRAGQVVVLWYLRQIIDIPLTIFLGKEKSVWQPLTSVRSSKISSLALRCGS
jgi:hypothetical protein